VEVHPAELTGATFSQPQDRSAEIRLELALTTIPLSDWHPKSLRLYLSGDHTTATDLFLLLGRQLAGIVLAPIDSGSGVWLPADCLAPAGFAEGEGLLPYPSHAFPGYRLLQEYFNMPQKLPCFDLVGWERWQQRGSGKRFSITFQFDKVVARAPRIRKENFVLHAVPAVNLFALDAEPVSVDHRTSRYPIRPSGLDPAHGRIFSVDRVSGSARASGEEREYLPFELCSGDHGTTSLYHALPAQSSRHGGYDVQLSLSFPRGRPSPGNETLSISLTCTNGSLPEKLRIGDITQSTCPLPESVSARNITPITAGQDPPVESVLLRRLISHLYLNRLPLERADHLRALLELYVFPSRQDGCPDAANLKRIAGIESVKVTGGERRVGGTLLRGREIHLTVRLDHFAGPGDLYLFGCLLDRFFGCYSALNCYTRLELFDTVRGVSWQWPTRLGNRPLN
jgi:type VI secretion system protein ImpG